MSPGANLPWVVGLCNTLMGTDLAGTTRPAADIQDMRAIAVLTL
jgi:hypothetical protein